MALRCTSALLLRLMFNAHAASGLLHNSVTAERASLLEVLWDAHMAHEFDPGQMSTAATMRTMTDDPHVTHVPTLIGGHGKDEVEGFYEHHFIFSNPAMSITPISRTIGFSQIVDEIVIAFNHSRAVDWLAPGVAPTGKEVRFPLVVVVKFNEQRGELKIAHEHIYWDQAGVLLQLGVLPGSSAAPLDVSGPEQADSVLHPGSVPMNAMLARTGRLQGANNCLC